MHEHLAMMKQKRTVFDHTASFFDAHALSNAPIKYARSKKKKEEHTESDSHEYWVSGKKNCSLLLLQVKVTPIKKKVTPANNNIDLKKKKGRKQKS